MENKNTQTDPKPTAANTDQQQVNSPTDQNAGSNEIEGSDVEYKAGNSPYSDFNTDQPLTEGKTNQKHSAK